MLIARKNHRIGETIGKNQQKGKGRSEIGNFERTLFLNGLKGNWRSYNQPQLIFVIKKNYKLCVRLYAFMCMSQRGREDWYPECRTDTRPVSGKNDDAVSTSMI